MIYRYISKPSDQDIVVPFPSHGPQIALTVTVSPPSRPDIPLYPLRMHIAMAATAPAQISYQRVVTVLPCSTSIVTLKRVTGETIVVPHNYFSRSMTCDYGGGGSTHVLDLTERYMRWAAPLLPPVPHGSRTSDVRRWWGSYPADFA